MCSLMRVTRLGPKMWFPNALICTGVDFEEIASDFNSQRQVFLGWAGS